MQEPHSRTSTKVRVDTHISCGAAQTLALPVRDVLLGLRVAVLLGHAKVDDVNNYERVELNM